MAGTGKGTERSEVAVVRSFNRAVTRQVGALQDHYLGRDRPLGEARVLWEIGDTGSDLRSLRLRLGLDSGYLSRLLRSLAQAGLVAVTKDPGDRRARTARLTPRGRSEVALLDRRSDQVAIAILDPLTGSQRLRLVEAMSEVERLLSAAMVKVERANPDGPLSRWCLREYVAELDRSFPTGFDPAAGGALGADELRPPAGLFVLATVAGEALGCGGLRFHEGWAEVKRLWVRGDARRIGLGRRVLAELEGRAAENGFRTVRLDTNRGLAAAIAMYRAAGYREVPPFNDNPYAHHWFEKDLGPGVEDSVDRAGG
jgi:DNA-binding MarR family transcriptional regulator/ribosomal protein S18 acetylase RimI-like enzyme